MKYLKLISIALIVFLSCKNKVKNDADNIIKELDFLKKVDTLRIAEKISLHQSRYYIVDKNIEEKDRDTLIKVFVQKFNNTLSDTLVAFDLLFYKESETTNESHLKSDPRDLDRYSQDNDLVWNYFLNKTKKQISGFKFKEGKIINQGDSPAITIKDIK